jgi:thiol-disulfide isomerase/thioredoxin
MKMYMKRFSKKYKDDIIIGGVDYNYNKETVRNQGVKSLPTFKIYIEGKEVFTISGMKHKLLEDELKRL